MLTSCRPGGAAAVSTVLTGDMHNLQAGLTELAYSYLHLARHGQPPAIWRECKQHQITGHPIFRWWMTDIFGW